MIHTEECLDPFLFVCSHFDLDDLPLLRLGSFVENNPAVGTADCIGAVGLERIHETQAHKLCSE